MAFGGLKGTFTGGATSVSTSLVISTGTGTLTVAVGDLIYAIIAEQAASTCTAVTDNLGSNSYTPIATALDAGATVTGRAFYSRVNSAGTLSSITFTTNGGTNNAVGLVAIIEGPFIASPLDTNPTGITNDNTTPFTCPATGTLGQAQEVVLNFAVHTGNVTLTATSPNLKAVQLNTASILTAAIGYQLVAATTSVAPAWTSSGTPTESAYATASFKQDLLQALTPGLYTDADSFNAPTLAPGSVGITPSLYADPDTFYAPAVTQSGAATTFVSYAATSPFYRYRHVPYSEAIAPFIPSVVGVQGITPSLFSDADTFFAPSVGITAVSISYASASPTYRYRYIPHSEVIHPPPQQPYRAQAVRFNGTTTIMGAVPSGIANGRVGTLSFWFKMRGGDGNDRRFFVSQSGNNHVAMVTINNKLSIDWVNTSGTNIFSYTSTASFASGGGWHYLIASWDLNSGARAVYIDDALDAATPTVITGQDIDYVHGFGAGTNYYIGGDISEARTINADIADFYFDISAYIDLSVTTNRRKFLLADGYPAFLGTDGHIPTGSAPIIFMSGDWTTWNVNDGTGGGFTVLDVAVTASDTIPFVALTQGTIPALFTDADTFYAPTVTATANIGTSLYSDSDTFFVPLVGAGPVGISVPTLLTDADTFYAPTVTASYQILTALFSDVDVFYSPTLAGTVGVSPTLFVDADAFFAPTLVSSTGITPALFVDTDAFFTPTLSAVGGVTPTLFTDTDAFFAPTVAVASVSASVSYASASPQYRHRSIPASILSVVVRTPLNAIYSSLLVDGDTFYVPTVTASYPILPALFSDVDTFYSPTLVSATGVSPALFSDADTFFAPTVLSAGGISPSLFVDADVFFAPTVAGGMQPSAFVSYAGAEPLVVRRQFIPPMSVTVVFGPLVFDQNVSPSLLVDADTFFAPTLVGGAAVVVPVSYAGASPLNMSTRFIPPMSVTVVIRTPLDQNITPSLLVDADTFFVPVMAAGTVNISPTLFTDADTFFQPVVSGGGVQPVAPSLLTDADVFFAPLVAAGAVNVSPALFTDADVFFAPILLSVRDLTPSLFTDADSFFTPTVGVGTVGITPALFSDADVFFAPTVTAAGVQGITPALFTDVDVFFAPVVGAGARDISPALFADADVFFAPTLALASGITPSLFVDTDTFFAPVVYKGFITPSLFIDPDSFYEPRVALSLQQVFPQHLVDADQFFMPAIFTEPRYDYPVGHSLESDYGIRKSRLRRGKYIIGRV